MPKKKQSKSKPQLVAVVWTDAFDGPTGWIDPREYSPHPVTPISIGWLLPDYLQGYITLVGTYLQDSNENKQQYYSNPAHIPLGMVQSITYIDVPKAILGLLPTNQQTRGLNAD